MITTNFEKFNFHDASIEKVTRELGKISIEFKGAFMSKEHSDSGATDWIIDKGILNLCNVTAENPLFWYDNIEGKPHPNPDVPIDEIQNLDFDGQIFEFGGFLNREPWVQWQVTATEFIIEIKDKHPAYS